MNMSRLGVKLGFGGKSCELSGQMPCNSSGFIYFSLANQLSISRNLGPYASVHDVAQTILTSWNALSHEERCIWEGRRQSGESYFTLTKATKGKKRSHKDISPDREKLQTKKKAIKKQSDRPNRPMSAYIHFAQKMRPFVKADNPTLNGLEITKLVGKTWNQATAQERIPYMQLEESSRVRYKQAISEWRKNQHGKQSNLKQKNTSKKTPAVAAAFSSKLTPKMEVKGEHYRANIESITTSLSSRISIIPDGGHTEHEIKSQAPIEMEKDGEENKVKVESSLNPSSAGRRCTDKKMIE